MDPPQTSCPPLSAGALNTSGIHDPRLLPLPGVPPSSAAMGIGIGALAQRHPPCISGANHPSVAPSLLSSRRALRCRLLPCLSRGAVLAWLADADAPARATDGSRGQCAPLSQPDSPWAASANFEMDAWAEGLVEGLWEPSPNTSPSKDTTAQMGAAGGFTVGAGGVLRQELERNLAQGTGPARFWPLEGLLAAENRAQNVAPSLHRGHLPPGARGPTPYMSELRRPRPPLRLCGSCGRPARVRALL